ncbi:MAG: metallophosphoesterase [Candidatus Odinarchaeota archaeon]
MRVVAFSDTHIDINSMMLASNEERAFTRDFIDVLRDSKPDILVCAGDVTPDSQLLEKTLRTIVKEVKAHEYFFVPGNHDIWFGKSVDAEGTATSSLDKHERLLPLVTKSAGFHFLPGRPLAVDKIGFLGSTGWYDYSFRDMQWDNEIDQLHYAAKRHSGLVWNDVNYAEWEMSDPKVCDWMIKQLEKDYKELQNQGIDECILILHHVPFRDFVSYKNDLSWDFFSAFIGSKKFGEWALTHSEISTVIFGHTHFQKNGIIDSISCYCNPVGYLHEAGDEITDLRKFLKSRLTIIEK